mmetsp:Transcript_5538/g.10443  ORF Transcript_5538/g.10443 Transcript_5538/m.10443 type:complete len:547 (-) Transcript_5538:140-1780(-)
MCVSMCILHACRGSAVMKFRNLIAGSLWAGFVADCSGPAVNDPSIVGDEQGELLSSLDQMATVANAAASPPSLANAYPQEDADLLNQGTLSAQNDVEQSLDEHLADSPGVASGLVDAEDADATDAHSLVDMADEEKEAMPGLETEHQSEGGYETQKRRSRQGTPEEGEVLDDSGEEPDREKHQRKHSHKHKDKHSHKHKDKDKSKRKHKDSKKRERDPRGGVCEEDPQEERRSRSKDKNRAADEPSSAQEGDVRKACRESKGSREDARPRDEVDRRSRKHEESRSSLDRWDPLSDDHSHKRSRKHSRSEKERDDGRLSSRDVTKEGEGVRRSKEIPEKRSKHKKRSRSRRPRCRDPEDPRDIGKEHTDGDRKKRRASGRGAQDKHDRKRSCRDTLNEISKAEKHSWETSPSLSRDTCEDQNPEKERDRGNVKEQRGARKYRKRHRVGEVDESSLNMDCEKSKSLEISGCPQWKEDATKEAARSYADCPSHDAGEDRQPFGATDENGLDVGGAKTLPSKEAKTTTIPDDIRDKVRRMLMLSKQAAQS